MRAFIAAAATAVAAFIGLSTAAAAATPPSFDIVSSTPATGVLAVVMGGLLVSVMFLALAFWRNGVGEAVEWEDGDDRETVSAS